MQMCKIQSRLLGLIFDGLMDVPEQLIQFKMVLPSHIHQGVEALRGTTHAQQAKIHEQLQCLWVVV